MMKTATVELVWSHPGFRRPDGTLVVDACGKIDLWFRQSMRLSIPDTATAHDVEMLGWNYWYEAAYQMEIDWEPIGDSEDGKDYHEQYSVALTADDPANAHATLIYDDVTGNLRIEEEWLHEQAEGFAEMMMERYLLRQAEKSEKCSTPGRRRHAPRGSDRINRHGSNKTGGNASNKTPRRSGKRAAGVIFSHNAHERDSSMKKAKQHKWKPAELRQATLALLNEEGVKSGYWGACSIDPQWLIDLGFPPAFVLPMVEDFDDHSAPIVNYAADGTATLVKHVRAVSVLKVLRTLASVFGVDTRKADSEFGRKASARLLAAGIKKVTTDEERINQ